MLPTIYGLPMNMSTSNFQPSPSHPDFTLYVGDLEPTISEEFLQQQFMPFQNLYSIRIMRDAKTKESRGFAFVTFQTATAATAAKDAMNNKVLLKRPIRVCWKKSPQERDNSANVYVRNLPQQMKITEFENLFKQYGAISSPKIAYDDKGSQLGYGYIQFEKKEDAEKCLLQTKEQPLKWNDSVLEVCQYNLNIKKTETRNNLYIKNLPKDIKNQEIEQKLREIFEQYGTILSILVKNNEQTGSPFAFICYGNQNDREQTQAEQYAKSAQQAVQNLNGKDLFKTGENIYVNWFEGKQERQKRLKQSYAYQKNETNLFTKNLKEFVTSDQLKKAFEVFGEIVSAKVVKPSDSNFEKKNKATVAAEMKTQFGFINFKSKESAINALKSAYSKQEIVMLYKDPSSLYINFHLSKSQLQQFQQTQEKSKKMYQNQSSQQNQSEMFQSLMQQFFEQFNMAQPLMQQYNYQRMLQNSMPLPMQNKMGMMQPGMPFMPQQQMSQFQNFANLNMKARAQQMNNMDPKAKQQQFNNYKRNANFQQGGQKPKQQKQFPPNMMMNNQQMGMNNQQIKPNFPQQMMQQQMPNQIPQQFPQQMQLPGQLPNQQFQQMPNAQQIQFQQRQMPQQQIPNAVRQPAIQQNTPQINFATHTDIKNHLADFQNLDQDRQRRIFGDLIYPQVIKYAQNKENSPKITGMLIDFEVFEINDILEFFEDENILADRVKEAEELIEQTTQE